MEEISLNKQEKYKTLIEQTKEQRWKPGQSGNPGGRPPKDVCITTLVKELLEQEAEGGKTHAQLVAEAIVKLAEDYHFKGNVSAIKELLDRIEGKVTDTHLIAGIIITPELLEQAQKRLSVSLKGTQELMEKYNATK